MASSPSKSVKDVQPPKSPRKRSATSWNGRRGIPQRLVARLKFWFASMLAGYLAFLAILTIPVVQTNLLYLYRVNLPFPKDLERPEKYGFAPYKTRNLRLNTSDGESLGAWHVLPHPIYREAIEETGRSDSHQALFAPLQPLDEGVFETSLQTRDTVIYFHGNAMNRATPHRVQSCMAFSNKLDVNVIAVDYRGYGDSTGTPSEDGLLRDAETVWEYVNARAMAPGTAEGKTIVVVGHSLGTAVSSRLVGALADRGVDPKAVVLIAPFTSLPELLTTYRLAGIPLISPLTWIPSFYDLLVKFLRDTWMSKDHLLKTKAPILIIHAKDDHDIPASHSQHLYDLLSRNRSSSGKPWLPKVTHREGWGSVALHTTQVHDGKPTRKGAVAYFEADHGAHNRVGGGEGVIELMRVFLSNDTPDELESSIMGSPSKS
ncbi:hypothetical protein NliqN6_3833 [Naganishia liquefaciens]|uniref:AB hydrolase-1 domain-containing protein n=1 Tax=Naganishia liquefaciens TaxID=104408 RepID=A0A8H3YH96_9TREE|nr:hypothetical protein NliqN6_3833 [Naganishia liquefaciens]